jgi:hypothetical protein
MTQSTACRRTLPRGLFDAKLLAARGGELVVARASAVLGHAPRCREPPAPLHADERGVQRPLRDEEDVFRHLLNALRDTPAMHRLERQRLENHHLEGALQQFPGLGGHVLPLLQIV